MSSGIKGNGSVSIKRDNTLPSLIANTGYKNIQALHEASLGDTSINLQALVAPADAVANGYSAPSASDLAEVNIKLFKENVSVESSSGQMEPFVDYVISGAQIINLLRPVQDGEVFTITIQSVPKTGTTLVDGQPLVVTGTLVAGTTDFSVGPYQVGQFPGEDHGSVLIIVDAQVAYRNDGNQPASLAVKGDYQELANIIRFNSTSTEDRQISVLSVGSLVERPQESMLALIESVQGQIDGMVPTLAALAGVPETDFQATPNQPDLKAFGDRVLTNENVIELLKTSIVPITSPAQSATPSWVTTTGTIPPASSENLDWWRDGEFMVIRYFRAITGAGTGGGVQALVIPNGEEIDTTFYDNYGGTGGQGQMGGGSWFDDSAAVGLNNRSTSMYGIDPTKVAILGNHNGLFGLNTDFGANDRVSGLIRVKIKGWAATQTLAEQLGI